MTNKNFLSILAAACAIAAGCSQTNATQPTGSTTTADTTALTASIAAPRPLTPANNAQIRNADQPVALVVQNAISTKPGVTYTFEVATDAAFSGKIQTKDAVTEGASGQTAVRLDALAPARDYWWHARAAGSGTTGLFGAAYKFTVGPAITINPPVPIGPLNAQTTDQRPVLRVVNAGRSGPAGAITYRFEIATTPAFGTILITGIVPEGVNETGFIPPSDLPLNATLYWRASASDALNGIVSAPSTVQSFTTSRPSQAAAVAAQLGVALWPGVQPPGAPGHATMGSFWTVEPLVSFNGIRFQNPPIDQLQIFDLMDRGMDPQSAIDWMHGNGYQTVGVYYPSVAVIGFPFEYMAFINGRWDIVLRTGA